MSAVGASATDKQRYRPDIYPTELCGAQGSISVWQTRQLPKRQTMLQGGVQRRGRLSWTHDASAPISSLERIQLVPLLDRR